MNAPRYYTIHQAAMLKGSTMIPLRSIIVPGIGELNQQGRKERTGMMFVIVMQNWHIEMNIDIVFLN
ncbi:hypothetical protein [Paenibacillus sp. 1781tsa1]|uniref:hypothetical protein n=1 Tax=Paenibacillus sp. 1781tsa1 TaxID=2953810 RepID=UPI00209D6FAA|nr:hypothetical protein [Paenibacillus sp. 1781tsa1]MCP1184678.1 hypothetical protein [Paenibacillus sp. 1781tsa1]